MQCTLSVCPPGVSYTNSFADVSLAIVILDSGEPIANFLDVGGASNAPARYYRVRLVQ
jgi:hypothetical protein